MNGNITEPLASKQAISPWSWVALFLVFGAALALVRLQSVAQTRAASPANPGNPTNELAALRAEIELLKGKAPDQAHAMQDVGHHFANLWFAGQKRNWPLAKFYLDETRSHLKWGVRIIPVRKTKVGDLDLRGILEAVDNTFLSQIQKSIDAKNMEQFAAAYKQTLQGCYDCHKASEKPFIRPQIPEQPEASIINFDPDATWPE